MKLPDCKYRLGPRGKGVCFKCSIDIGLGLLGRWDCRKLLKKEMCPEGWR
jgi:hypothetical protein